MVSHRYRLLAVIMVGIMVAATPNTVLTTTTLMGHDTPPDPPHDDYPESFETFWRGGDAYGRDDRGNEFKLDAGSPEPVEGRCNAPLRDYQRRYGEKRYCTQLPAKNFPGYDSDYCKLHKSMEALEDRWQELFRHGYFAESYVHVARHIEPTKFLFAVEMFGGLMELSNYKFEPTEEPISLDVSDSLLIQEDVVQVDLPIPTNDLYQFQANELWMAALDEVRMRKMQDAIFEDGVAKSTTVATAEAEGAITDRIQEDTEHHLNLPISRVTKDIKEHLKNGGVEIDAEGDDAAVTFQKNDYTLDISPDEESSSDGAQDVSETAQDFTERLDSEDDAVIEVTE